MQALDRRAPNPPGQGLAGEATGSQVVGEPLAGRRRARAFGNDPAVSDHALCRATGYVSDAQV